MPERTVESQITVSMREAIAILGIGERHVRRLICEGILRTSGPRAKNGFRIIRSDVTELADLRKKGRSRVTALHAMALARRLERELDEVKSLLCLRSEKLGLEEKDVVEFYSYADELSTNGSIKVEDIEPLLYKLQSVDEYYLGLVEKFTQNKEPWSVFTKLAQHLHATVLDDRTKALANSVRTNLRNAAFVYAKSTHTNGRENYNFQFDDNKLVRRLLEVILNPDPTATNQNPPETRTDPTPS